MAFTAQQQSEAIARIQAFLQLKRETDPTLKDAIPEGPVDGDLGASGSPTRKGIDAWLAKRNLASVIQENDPQYLEKLDAAVRADAATDFVLLQRLRTMAEAAAADPARLDRERSKLADEIHRQQARRESLPEGGDIYARSDAGIESYQRLTDAQRKAAHAENVQQTGTALRRAPAMAALLLAGASLLGWSDTALSQPQPQTPTDKAARYVNDQAAAYSVDKLMATDPLSAEQTRAGNYALAFLKENGLLTDRAQEIVGADGVDKPADFITVQNAIRANMGILQEKATAMAQNPAATSRDQILHMQAALGMFNAAYAMPMSGSLGNPALMSDTQAWGAPGVAMLEKFLKDTGKPLPPRTASAAPGAASPNGQPPAAAPMAASSAAAYFIDNVVLNGKGYDIHSRRVWNDIRQNGTDPGHAIEDYLTAYQKSFPAGNRGKTLPAAEINKIRDGMVDQISHLIKLQNQMKDTVVTPDQLASHYIKNSLPESFKGNAIAEVAQAIRDYESIAPTADDAARIMRKSWQEHNVDAARIPAYETLLKERIAACKDAPNSSYDDITATARAMVDLRAQIDRDRGAPPRSIVDQNHPNYQSDITTMGDWLRKQMYLEQETAKAAAQGRSTSLTEIMEPLEKSRYTTYRRTNFADTAVEVYESGKPSPAAPAPAPTAAAAPPPKTTAVPPAAAPPVAAATPPAAPAAPAGPSPQEQIAQIEQKQLRLVENVLNKHGSQLTPYASTLKAMNIDINNPEKLVQSLRTPATQNTLNTYAFMLPQDFAAALRKTMSEFNALESGRRELQQRPPAPTSSQSKQPQGGELKTTFAATHDAKTPAPAPALTAATTGETLESLRDAHHETMAATAAPTAQNRQDWHNIQTHIDTAETKVQTAPAAPESIRAIYTLASYMETVTTPGEPAHQAAQSVVQAMENLARTNGVTLATSPAAPEPERRTKPADPTVTMV